MKDYSFGNHICTLRTELGLSQFQLGTLVGVSDKAVSKWENGDARPRIRTCHRLASVLGVSIDELLSCKRDITISARKELDKMNRKLWKEAYSRLSVYGEHPPAICWSRLASEEASLCGTDAIQGFAVMGLIQAEARKKNTAIIATGSVNSSFTAWLFGGTYVDPMPANYRCPNCGHTLFVPDVKDGFDLPPKRCDCGTEFMRDGHDIPFQGYAKTAQKGTHLEFRTSSSFIPHAVTVLKSFYKDVAEVLPVRLSCHTNEICLDRYIILPETKPHPPLAEDGFWHCSLDDFWQWQAGETSYMFTPSKQLDALEERIRSAGEPLPDPRTLMTHQMIRTIYENRCGQLPLSARSSINLDLLIRMDGLSHATFAKDRQEIFRSFPLEQIPATREDIWKHVSTALETHGVRNDGYALLVMENAIKGLYHRHGVPDSHRKLLTSLGLPEWYPELLEDTLYLFPKGHCIAHLLTEALMLWYQNK